MSGNWKGTESSLKGGPRADANHAKIGVSLSNVEHLTILADMNQEGTLTKTAKNKCAVSQNVRGGLFFVVHDDGLTKSIFDLIDGDTALTTPPKKPSK